MDTEKLTLTQEWDKAYLREESVGHKKVPFRNHFGIELAADLFSPKEAEGKYPAIAVCGAFGAVKEQHSGLYAQEMAKRGFLTIAFDPSFTYQFGRILTKIRIAAVCLTAVLAALSLSACRENSKEETASRVSKESVSAVSEAEDPHASMVTEAVSKPEESRMTESGVYSQQKAAEGMKMFINGEPVHVEWESNASVEALKQLAFSNKTIEMFMYGGFEQVGSLGKSLPREDSQTTTAAGDIVLYSGDQMVVFYGSNSWAYTRLGHITDKSADELTELLGNGNVTVTLSMSE